MLGPGSTVHWLLHLHSKHHQPQRWVFAGTQEVAFLWVRREVIESSRLFSIWMKCILYLWIIGMIKTFTVQHFSAIFGGRRHSKRTQYALSGTPVFWFFYNHKTCFIIKWWLPPWRSDGLFTLFWKKKSSLKKTVDQCLLSTHEVPGPSPVPQKTRCSGLWSQSRWCGDKKMKNSETSLDKWWVWDQTDYMRSREGRERRERRIIKKR